MIIFRLGVISQSSLNTSRDPKRRFGLLPVARDRR